MKNSAHWLPFLLFVQPPFSSTMFPISTTMAGFLSEDTVAKVKVLGKGEAGLKELERYIPRENIPEFLGGESVAVMGPTDPLWVEVDMAMRAWGQGEDPFLDRGDVLAEAARIGRERAAAASAAAAIVEAEEDEEEFVEAGVGDAEGVTAAAKKGRDGGQILARGFPARNDVVRMGEEEAEVAAAVVAKEEEVRDVLGQKKTGGERVKMRVGGSKARRKADPARRRGREGGAHRRRRHAVLGHAGTAGSLRQAKSKAKVSVVRGDGLDARLRRRRREDVARKPEKEAGAEEGIEEEGEEAVADRREAETLGARVVGVLLGSLVPVLAAVFAQVVNAALATARVLLSAAEDLFRFLRDALFELVEVEE